MQIKKVVIKGYKNLINFRLDFKDAKTSVLIGNNGSGKSNSIEALSSIFAGLYDESKMPDFKFLINYSINNTCITVNKLGEDIIYNVGDNIVSRLTPQQLPSQIIASYSGEDNRLWQEFYEPFYKKYIDDLKGAGTINLPLIYLNKYYWNIALLTFYFYDFEIFKDIKRFCEETLEIEKMNYIEFQFNTIKIKKWQENPITYFVKRINPDNKESVKLTLQELKENLNYITSEIDFFKYLSAAYMPKDDKLIKSIRININNDITTDSLSEGEKKLILIKLILEVVGDQDSLILLDEPDSHVHISRKRDLQEQLDSYDNRNNIITTHSPTLTHCFESKQIRILSRNGDKSIKVSDNFDKKNSIIELTDGIWSYEQQTIFLSTTKDILLVEGKTDVDYILNALKKLKPLRQQFVALNFEIFPFNGAANLSLIIDKFKPQFNQKIIALLDRDKAGEDALKELFPNETIDRLNYNYKTKGDVIVAMLPCKKYYRGVKNSFLIEDYFYISKIKNFVFPKDCKSFASIGNKDNIKNVLARECPKFSPREFKGFETLFELLIEIKNTD